MLSLRGAGTSLLQNGGYVGSSTIRALEWPKRNCPSNWFNCGNGKCIAKMWLCDEDNDCGNLKDEENCEGRVHPEKCLSNQFQCRKNGHCVPESWRCDGEHDCGDSSDEKDCGDSPACIGFTCKDNHCIPNKWRCDGQEDCPDGSDEKECPNAKKCQDSQFACGSGSCLNLTQVCDGTKDCPDASDEGSHCGDSCANATCSHKCRSTPKGPECYCENGYELEKDNRTCLDIDECLEDGFCSHNCTNTAGGYECSCLLGYQLVNKTCQAEGPEPLLVFSTLQEIRGIHLRSKRYFLIQKAIYKAAAVDADPTDQRLYWVEISNRSSIYSAKLGGSELTTILSSGLQIPEDIAVDYIGRNLYITDSGLKQVLVCKIDGSVCHVLHGSNVEKPRSLKLDPPKGILYWSDWGRETVGIYKSGMDGSNRTALVSTNIFWPNGIAVDHTTNRLFWTDARLHSIESITLDGSDRKTIIKDSVHHPYSLTVFEDNLYWSDWNTFSLDSCNKFTGHKMTLMVRENGKHIMGVHVYHPVLAPAATNPCWSHSCSHMCVLAPQETYHCVCPSGYKLSNDNRTCIMDNRFPSLFVTEDFKIFHTRPEMVGSESISVLPVNRISSIGKVEYDWKSRTLFIVDFSKPSIDYFNMTSLTEGTLLENHLILPEDLAFDWLSDILYWVDSGKGSVEVISIRNRNVSTILADLAKPTALALAPSQGIMFVSTIDNSEVSMYNMDGKNRKLLHRVSGSVISVALHPVKSRLYWADITAEKIFSLDYMVPMSEIKTERNRAGSVVSIAVSEKYMYWTDTKNRQLHLKQENSSYVHIIPLPGIGNANAARKITYTRVSDSTEPPVCAVANGGCSHICLSAPNGRSCVCPLGMTISGDNATCQSKECGKDDFRCKKSQVCIPNKYYCDGTIDCNDGSDEHYLSSRCVGNDFRCRNGRCILQEWKCDHRDDCGDSSDETDCPVQTSCGKNEFSCGGGECITMLWRCDGEKDCNDNSDESNCHETSCDHEMQFRCDHGQCIPRSWVCDGAPDCYDSTDEINCTINQRACEATQFRCEDGTCIDKILVCDSRNDCQDGSDERNCSSKNLSLLSVVFMCISNIVTSWYLPALRPCVKGEFQCPSKHCIPSRYVCDGDDDCLDGADEDPNHCLISLKPVSPPNPEECNEFYCYVSKTCIPWSQVCDGRRDCEDLPDEGGLCSKPCSNHHGCAQLCRRTPQGPRCDCNSGFILTADEKTCVDLNECLIPGRCSHFCNNTKGGFKCSCADGYILERDHRKCKADGGSATLVYMLEDEIRGIDLGSLSQRVYLSHESSNMKGIDFDAEEDVFFWSDGGKGTINSYNLNARKKLELIRDDRKPSYIRRDWITKNIYYPNDHGAIKVCNKDGSFCATLLENIAPHINSFAISPPNGLMFWSVWAAVRHKEHAVIERADLDGSNRVAIVFEKIVSPNAITVDEILKLIFWTDSKLNTLEYSDFHGLQRKVVYSGDMFYPYSMAIFEDFAYWADWGTDTIFKCDKFTGKEYLEFHKGNIRADDMMVVHKVKQPKRENRCEGKCTQLCLLTQTSYTCKCGNSYIMRNSSCIFQPTPKPTHEPKLSCPDSYCEQDARCVAVGGEFSCWCPDGFTGDRCEIKIAERKKSYDYSWVVMLVFSIFIITSIVILYLLCKKDKEKINKVTESVAVRFRNPIFGRKRGQLVLDEDGDSACTELVIATKGYYKKIEFGYFLSNPLFGKNPHERHPQRYPLT
ncbi:LOW QUALITY PROTEIN: low-density lipoprotein receptor-related protein 2-like [Uloborus diversus]|uniref:LOW QUALITY PROTEIN: low-density lipoprotein receptor-related protein 2-like n=1 Tax=Uloborus diversus TaxID=327109 RepID=UPI002409DF7C|nr:LOW QUALITY PROTEIN: low-density lipoprotein receptor-related protein 2-like [Uloborus diversus]